MATIGKCGGTYISTEEAEVRRLWVQSQFGLYSNTYTQTHTPLIVKKEHNPRTK